MISVCHDARCSFYRYIMFISHFYFILSVIRLYIAVGRQLLLFFSLMMERDCVREVLLTTLGELLKTKRGEAAWTRRPCYERIGVDVMDMALVDYLYFFCKWRLSFIVLFWKCWMWIRTAAWPFIFGSLYLTYYYYYKMFIGKCLFSLGNWMI
jgi:hypothetical protein